MDVKYLFYLVLVGCAKSESTLKTTDSCGPQHSPGEIPGEITAGTKTRVLVKQGWLSGKLLQTVTKDMYYYSFKGIPYAAPPVRALRFEAPQPPLSWNGVRNATEHGSVCPQLNIFSFGDEIIPGNEDCLFLNVYTPTVTPHTRLPVMVFIHGGGYQSGSGNVDSYGPDFLIEKYVIVVTLNYRLGALGFLSMGTEEVPGNAGMKDQVAALEWVQLNIGAFGGDPKKVTIIGQSAGSACVNYHILSPRSKGLFQRAIAMSGVPFCDFSLEFQPRRRAFLLGKLLGFETKNDAELLNFLQGIDAEKLLDRSPYVLASETIINNFAKLFAFVPVVEKKGSCRFLSEDPRVILSEGKINEVDVMFGLTNEEALTLMPLIEDYLMDRYNRYAEMVVPTKILFSSTPETILEISDKITDFYFGNKNISLNNMREFISYMNNSTFVYDIQRFYAKFPILESNKMFFYKFSSVSSRNVYGSQGAKYGITGAAHVDDLMYLFDAKSLNMTVDKNSTEYALIDQVTTVFTNFAKYGNPTPDDSLGVTWPEYNKESVCYVDIGSNLTVSCAPDAADMVFWKSIFEYANLPF